VARAVAAACAAALCPFGESDPRHTDLWTILAHPRCPQSIVDSGRYDLLNRSSRV
jgi:hypothetical protein